MSSFSNSTSERMSFVASRASPRLSRALAFPAATGAVSGFFGCLVAHPDKASAHAQRMRSGVFMIY